MRTGFPHSEILGSKLAWQLPGAYRRLQRPSSPVVAKASTTCTCSLDPITLSTARRHANGLRIDAWRRYGRLSHNAIITANAISYPDEPGSEKNRIRFTSSELLKSSRNTTNRRTSPAGGVVRGVATNNILVEPTGIEPVTSCLQSRRSPS